MQSKVYLKTTDFREEEVKPYSYLVARNGAFLVKENAAFKAIVEVDLAAELKLVEQEEVFIPKLPKIPFHSVQRAVNFFRAIKKLRGTEALLNIYYNSGRKEFDLHPPQQLCTSGSVVSVEANPTPEGWLLAGSIHSHPGGAFHSSVDERDEAGSDGLHITVGDLDAPIPQFDAVWVCKGHRFPWPVAEVLEYEFEVPAEWLERTTKNKFGRNVLSGTIFGGGH